VFADHVTVDLYWIPLGAGQPSVRFNGFVYERVVSLIQYRTPRAIYHSALCLTLPEARYMVEMTPEHRNPEDRGVVARGAVGSRLVRGIRLFRYEIRRWPEGVVPDLAFAVDSPVRVTDDPARTRRVFDALAFVPTPVWGRDELDLGEMWTCNSVIAWALAQGGADTDSLHWPPNSCAPGWDAGLRLAQQNRLAFA
jgi:hypothetical protein